MFDSSDVNFGRVVYLLQQQQKNLNFKIVLFQVDIHTKNPDIDFDLN